MKGNGCYWSRASLGCDLRIYGWENEAEHAIALQSAEQIRQAVAEAVPEAATQIRDSDDPAFGVAIHVRVNADDLAVFAHGPMHRGAINRASRAAGRALNDCAWTKIRLRS